MSLLRLHATRESLSGGPAPAKEAIRSRQEGVLLFDRAGGEVLRNAAAADILEELDVLGGREPLDGLVQRLNEARACTADRRSNAAHPPGLLTAVRIPTAVVFIDARLCHEDSLEAGWSVLVRLRRAGCSGCPRPLNTLTPRQSEVLDLVLDGGSTKSIARAIGTSTHTARHHVQAILSKLGVCSRRDLLVLAKGRGTGSLELV